MTEAAKNRVVVGVDGSEASLAALVWATEEAAGLGAEVEAVTVWTHDAMLDDASAERTLAEARNVHLHDLEAQVTVALKGLAWSLVPAWWFIEITNVLAMADRPGQVPNRAGR